MSTSPRPISALPTMVEGLPHLILGRYGPQRAQKLIDEGIAAFKHA